jgi:hypothetical protein
MQHAIDEEAVTSLLVKVYLPSNLLTNFPEDFILAANSRSIVKDVGLFDSMQFPTRGQSCSSYSAGPFDSMPGERKAALQDGT